MLAGNGLVAECSGENVFVSRHDTLITPPLSAGALEGITQSTVLTLARDLGFDAVCDNLARSDLYIADEMFLVGTAAEVSSVNSVDDRSIPCPGPMTTAIAELYGQVVRGQVDRYLGLVRTRRLTGSRPRWRRAPNPPGATRVRVSGGGSRPSATILGAPPRPAGRSLPA